MGIDRQWNNGEVDDRPESAAQEAWRQIRPRIAERFGSATPIVENFDAVVSNDVVIVVMGPAPYALLRGGERFDIGVGKVVVVERVEAGQPQQRRQPAEMRVGDETHDA